VVTATLLVAWFAAQARYSMLFASYAEIARASAVTRSYLDALAARIGAAAPGEVIVVPRPTTTLGPVTEVPRLQAPLLLLPYALQSWADVAFPDRTVRVAYQKDASAVAAAGEIVVAFAGVAPRPR
jgi:hypothetical protein